MANAERNYNATTQEGNPFTTNRAININTEDDDDDDLATDTDNDDIPHNSGLMIHVVPDTSKGYLILYEVKNRI